MNALRGARILMTGGTGSFGRAFTRAILALPVKRVVIFSRDELKQHEMRQEFIDERLRFFIGDVRDRERVKRAMVGIDIVIHAAAMKQVPTCEYDPDEAIKTNVLGTMNVVSCAIERGVKRVIGLSSDKAVSPINTYGKTKALLESLMVQGNVYAASEPTRFACVRYGNVVGSRGSVVPLFKLQAERGYITLTDIRMTRFWITLQQGVDLVLRALDEMQGGEIFVPQIPSMRLMDLARAMAPTCRIDFTGIRPGEKLHECLINEDEARRTTHIDGGFIIWPEFPLWHDKPKRRGESLPSGFSYRSDTNDEWLTIEQLRGMINDE